MTEICGKKPMVRFVLKPESRFPRKPEACLEVSKGPDPCPVVQGTKSMRNSAAVLRGQAVTSFGSSWNGVEPCSRRGCKKRGPLKSVAALRGGSWNNNSTNARVSDRNNASWANTNRNNNIGARVASTPRHNRTMGVYRGEMAGGQATGSRPL